MHIPLALLAAIGTAIATPVLERSAQRLDARELVDAARVHMLNARARSGNGYDIRLTNWNYDSGYTVDLKAGTPPQTFPAALNSMDDSLTLFWHNVEIKGDPGFDKNKSSTFHTDNVPAGQFTVVATDTVTLGNETVSKQAFKHATPPFGNKASFGFSFPLHEWDSTNETSLWHAQYPQWVDKQVGFYFKRYAHYDPNRKDSGTPVLQKDGGAVTVGGVDTTKISGDFNYIALPSNPRYWQVPLEGLIVQGSTIDLTLNSTTNSTGNSTSTGAGGTNSTRGGPNVAIINTGTNYIQGPKDVVARIYALIPGSGTVPPEISSNTEYYLPCNTTNLSVSFQFGGKTYSVHNDDLIGSKMQDNRVYGGEIFHPPEGSCSGLFIGGDFSNSTDLEPGTWLVGSAFLKNVYTAFRFDPPAVGFATLTEEAQKSGAARAAGAAVGTVLAAVLCAVVAAL